MCEISFISGIRLPTKTFPTDEELAKIFYPFPGHEIDIFSNSWGPPNNGYSVASLGPLTVRALQTGTSKVSRSNMYSNFILAQNLFDN